METENKPQTYGDLRRLLNASPRGDWPSRVNASLTHTQALAILGDAVLQHADGARIDGARSGLLMRNVLRECHAREGDACGRS